MWQLFELKDGFTVFCDTIDTRNGFAHVGTLFDSNGMEITKTRINYINRTWERYAYETILKELKKFLRERRKERG